MFMYPETSSFSDGTFVLIPTFPLERIVKNGLPDEDATLNGFNTVEEDDWMLKANVEEVALIPATVPLSKATPVARVVAPV